MSLLRSMTGRKKTTIVLVLSVIVISSIFVTGFLLNTGTAQDDLELLDTNILVVMNEHHIPGVAACAVKNGEVVWTGTYGYANLEQSISVTNETLFMLGSVSKIVTGIAFMQLYEDGLIDLDDDINDYLPYEVNHPDYPNATITPRMLLSHVSGIHDNWNILGPLEVSGMDSPITLEVFTQGYLTPNGTYYHTTNFYDAEPGTEYEYTNVGSTLIAYLVEILSNTTFEEYCQQNIFLPLGMNNTSWFLSNLDTDMIAVPYLYEGISNTALDHYSSAVYPCGFMRTSVTQQAQLLIALMEGGALGETSILNNNTLQMMMTHHYPELTSVYGLFFEHFGVLWGHNGVGPGVSARMLFYPEAHEGVIVMANFEDPSALNTIHNDILSCMRAVYGWST
jgi:CubicO group peptidase (beta-lactamase class C family)